jgi:hypothetical protein
LPFTNYLTNHQFATLGLDLGATPGKNARWNGNRLHITHPSDQPRASPCHTYSTPSARATLPRQPELRGLVPAYALNANRE